MPTFYAANNLKIDADSTLWKLSAMSAATGQSIPPALSPSPNPPPPASNSASTPFLEATAEGMIYYPDFARARRLPDRGLDAAQIERVIVGWETNNWQLGVILSSDVADTRGGRWCGIAKWRDPFATLEIDNVRAAGELLAEVLRKPFQFMPAQGVPHIADGPPSIARLPSGPVTATRSFLEPSPATPFSPNPAEAQRAAIPDARTPQAPVDAGEWVLMPIGMGLRWERSASWKRSTLLRALFFGALALVFALLAFGGMRSVFAPVQPNWLPLVGIVVMIVMSMQAVYRLLSLWATSSTEFDRRNRLVRVIRRPTGVVRQIPFEKIEYILVSELPLRRTRLMILGDDAIERITAEAWIHLKRDKGDYLQVAHIAQIDGRAVRRADGKPEPRHPLTATLADSPAHHAALLIGEMIEVPVYADERA